MISSPPRQYWVHTLPARQAMRIVGRQEGEAMSRTATTTIRVEWGDCDPAGIVYYPNFFHWCDVATWNFFAASGLPLIELQKRYGIVGFPLLEASLGASRRDAAERLALRRDPARGGRSPHRLGRGPRTALSHITPAGNSTVRCCASMAPAAPRSPPRRWRGKPRRAGCRGARQDRRHARRCGCRHRRWAGS